MWYEEGENWLYDGKGNTAVHGPDEPVGCLHLQHPQAHEWQEVVTDHYDFLHSEDHL